ncbi:hypothetical protein AXW83_04045 [Bosea sp. PAMC 26642]|nr:hypothetical protein AXW83_04045 [Bosea sp. PAMC 26642]
MPYFVKRPEGGFSYTRDLSPKLFASLSGELALSWSQERRKVGGKQVLKIALGTTDLTLARQRWMEVHPQVENLIGFAKETFQRRTTRPSTVTRLQSLPREAIKQIAEDVYQRILASDDEEALTGRPADLTEIVLNEMGERGNDDVPNLFDAKRRAHLRELDHLRSHARRVDQFDFDGARQIPTLESLVREGMSPDSAKRAREDLSDVIGESAVEAVLAQSGVDLPHGHPDRNLLALEVIRAGIRGHSAVLERLEGAAVPTPALVAPIARTQPNEGVKLGEAYDTWKNERKPSSRTAEGYRLYVDRFIEINGDVPIASITKKHVRAYRDALTGCPRNVPKEMAGCPFWELHAWALAEGHPLLSRTTINDKSIGAISAILAVALRNGEIEANPCTGMKFSLKEGEAGKRKPYDDADLSRLLASPVFGEGKRYDAGGGEAQKWLPLISAYSGARLEEIGQLRVMDIKCEDEVHYFDLREIDDTPGQTTSRKTGSSRRRVPIHAMLIAKGLLAYAKEQGKAGHVRLFPDLVEYDGKTTHYFSKWWGRYARQFITKDKDKTFHSFRHRVTDELRKGKLYAVMQAILGHHVGDTTSGYGDGFDIGTLNEMLQGISYSKVDLSRI